MTKTFEAIYANGVLTPVHPLEGIGENDRVQVVLVAPATPHPLDDLIGTVSEEDAAEMMKIVDDEFSKVNPDDWK